MAHLGGEEVRSEAALALARGQDDVAQMRPEGGHGVTGDRSGSRQAREDGGDRGIGLPGAFSGRQRLVDQRADPWQLVEGRLRLEPSDRPSGVPDKRLAGGLEERGQPFQPARGGCQSVRQRGKLAGIQREQPATDQVDPLEWVPGFLAQLGLRESGGLQLADEEVAIDRLVSRQIGHRPELGQPTIRGRDLLRSPGRAHVGPSVVVGVLPDRCREGRVAAECFSQVFVDTALEVRHPKSLRAAGRRRLPPQPTGRYHAGVRSQTWVEPVILEGTRVRLEPLRRDHLADLRLVALDAPLWQWTIMGPQDEAGLERWLEAALANAETGAERPFATIDLASGRAVGSSRYMSIAPEHRRLEIGWTWIGSAFQRTGANREAKLLQLTHAFETLGANRVEFKTHARNERSRNALAGMGATFEGIFRQHMIMPDGSLRDSAWFSVIADEWPAVKARLQARAAPRAEERTDGG